MTEKRDWRDIGKGGSLGWEASNYETLAQEPDGDVARLTKERDEAREVAAYYLTLLRLRGAEPAAMPAGDYPWLNEKPIAPTDDQGGEDTG